MDIEHIAILKDLMKERIYPIKGDVFKSLKKSAVSKLGEVLDIQNIRMYLSSSSGRKMLETQVVGDPAVWKEEEIDVEKVKNEAVTDKRFNFFKIKYQNDNGRSITIGYLGIFREKKLSKQELSFLELLCLLYGDYIRKIITLTVQRKTKYQLPHIFEIAYSGSPSGTIITRCQDAFHRGVNAYASYYLVFDDNKLFIEYVKLKNSGHAFFPKIRTVNPSSELINYLQTSRKYFTLEAGDPKVTELLTYLKRYDDKIDAEYLFFFYPAKVENQVLGVWFFIFSDKQYFNSYELEGLIDVANPLIKNNYKYIYQRRTKKMVLDPIFKNRDTRIDNQKVFVIMPFTLEWSSRIWLQMLKPTIEKRGLNPMRADDLYGHDIMEDIWHGILSAKFVIADITGRNPNVFYELGIAHTLGKEVILITQNKDDIPFDLNRYRHIIYQDNYDGYEHLKSKLDATITDLMK